jgi:hypothetical protein
MYPSGSWRGFWDQVIFGRQSMRDLVLSFSDRIITGSGVDVVGPFSFEGTYEDNGVVSLIKRYPNHSVRYEGRWDGEGTIYGDWSIGPFAHEKFALTPERLTKPEAVEILEITAEHSIHTSAKSPVRDDRRHSDRLNDASS